MKSKTNLSNLVCYILIIVLFLFFGIGFLGKKIIYDQNEENKAKCIMLVNLKRLDFLKPGAMQTYEFNQYSRFSKRNPDIRMELAYTDADDAINYYASKGLEKGWKVQSIKQNRLIMHRGEIFQSKPVKVILQLEKIKENVWELTMKYEYT